MSKVKSGFWLVVEGMDGSGKTTICEYIAKQFGYTYNRALGNGLLGGIIRNKVLDSEDTSIMQRVIYNSTAVMDSVLEVKLLLDKGINVVSDRSIISNYVYNIHKADNLIRDLGMLHSCVVREINRIAVPDLYLYSRVSYDESKARLKARSETNHLDSTSRSEFEKRSLEYDVAFRNYKYNKMTLNGDLSIDMITNNLNVAMESKDDLGYFQDLELFVDSKKAKGKNKSTAVSTLMALILEKPYLDNTAIAAISGKALSSVISTRSKIPDLKYAAIIHREEKTLACSKLEQILELASYGKSVMGIARDLKISESEVIRLVPKLATKS